MNKNKMKYEIKKATRKVAKLGKKLRIKIRESISAFFFDTIKLVINKCNDSINFSGFGCITNPRKTRCVRETYRSWTPKRYYRIVFR